MNYAGKFLLAGAAMAALAVPVMIGFGNAPSALAQAQAASPVIAQPVRPEGGENRASAPVQMAQAQPAQTQFAPRPADTATRSSLLKEQLQVMRGAMQSALRGQEIGTLTDGRFHHTLTGTEFTLPLGWTVDYQGQSSGDGEQIGFTGDASGPPVSAFVWMRAEAHPGGELAERLTGSMNFKAGQRESEFTGYKMLKNTMIFKTVGGRQALSAQAQYTEKNTPMIEYNTWAYSETTHIYLSARMRAEDFAVNQGRIDQILGTFLIP
jgi:hypothetical protein